MLKLCNSDFRHLWSSLVINNFRHTGCIKPKFCSCTWCS